MKVDAYQPIRVLEHRIISNQESQGVVEQLASQGEFPKELAKPVDFDLIEHLIGVRLDRNLPAEMIDKMNFRSLKWRSLPIKRQREDEIEKIVDEKILFFGNRFGDSIKQAEATILVGYGTRLHTGLGVIDVSLAGVVVDSKGNNRVMAIKFNTKDESILTHANVSIRNNEFPESDEKKSLTGDRVIAIVEISDSPSMSDLAGIILPSMVKRTKGHEIVLRLNSSDEQGNNFNFALARAVDNKFELKERGSGFQLKSILADWSVLMPKFLDLAENN